MLKQAELGLPVADPIRQVGISEQTVYRWKKEYAGLGAAGSRVEAVGRKHAALEAGRRAELGQGRAAVRARKKFPPASAHERCCRGHATYSSDIVC